MKKLEKSSELMWVFGVIFVALGVAICSKANLGVSMIAAPVFVLHEALSSSLSWLTIGITEYIIQGILLILLCIIIRRFNWRFLFAFLVTLIYGFVIDAIMWAMQSITFQHIVTRWIMLFVGIFIIAFGVATFFRTYLPLQVYEFFVSAVAKRFNKSITRVKLLFDMSLLALSIILALTLFDDTLTFDWGSIYYQSFHSIGVGTLITAIINAPIISFIGKILDRCFGYSPCFPKMQEYFNQNF